MSNRNQSLMELVVEPNITSVLDSLYKLAKIKKSFKVQVYDNQADMLSEEGKVCMPITPMTLAEWDKVNHLFSGEFSIETFTETDKYFNEIEKTAVCLVFNSWEGNVAFINIIKPFIKRNTKLYVYIILGPDNKINYGFYSFKVK